jgi:hypothetical protein
MTERQFAIAASADIKWIRNSAAILQRPFRPSSSEARWWGLVRLLTDTLGLSLKAAAAAATRALVKRKDPARVTTTADPSESTILFVDVPRYESIFLASLSRALVRETPRRRGRSSPSRAGTSAVHSAGRYGIDLGLLRASLDRTPAERLELLEANAAFVRGMRKKTA